MKISTAFVMLIACLLSSSIFARTCPTASAVIYKNLRGESEVNVPAGWRFIEDTRKNKYLNVDFRVAAWGDHKHPTDAVRCYYYPSDLGGHIKIETIDLMDASHVASWGGQDNLYYGRVSYSNDVNHCSFI